MRQKEFQWIAGQNVIGHLYELPVLVNEMYFFFLTFRDAPLYQSPVQLPISSRSRQAPEYQNVAEMYIVNEAQIIDCENIKVSSYWNDKILPV